VYWARLMLVYLDVYSSSYDPLMTRDFDKRLWMDVQCIEEGEVGDMYQDIVRFKNEVTFKDALHSPNGKTHVSTSEHTDAQVILILRASVYTCIIYTFFHSSQHTTPSYQYTFPDAVQYSTVPKSFSPQNNLLSALALAASLLALCFLRSLASPGGLKNKLGLSPCLTMYARYPRCAGSR
jgi:hypothetical protein